MGKNRKNMPAKRPATGREGTEQGNAIALNPSGGGELAGNMVAYPRLHTRGHIEPDPTRGPASPSQPAPTQGKHQPAQACTVQPRGEGAAGDIPMMGTARVVDG